MKRRRRLVRAPSDQRFRQPLSIVDPASPFIGAIMTFPVVALAAADFADDSETPEFGDWMQSNEIPVATREALASAGRVTRDVTSLDTPGGAAPQQSILLDNGVRYTVITERPEEPYPATKSSKPFQPHE
jgi:hypothetical protein